MDKISFLKRYSLKLPLLSLVIALAIFAISGCAGYSGTYSVVATNKLDIERASEYIVSDENVESSSNMYFSLGYLWGSSHLPKNSVDKALQKMPGAVAMVDATYDHKIFTIPILFTIEKYKIYGKALIDPKIAYPDQNEKTPLE
ncbi:MAG: hypothetical protein PHF36_09580 [Candidatus Cloacimonetes bacterium]|jgi:hypothetical protein|nr:hypothetical protein [Acholeplasmataceae bacterium]MDD2651366.1 hypothetical protein [Candidatus Cloacimonadota bacterium]